MSVCFAQEVKKPNRVQINAQVHDKFQAQTYDEAQAETKPEAWNETEGHAAALHSAF